MAVADPFRVETSEPQQEESAPRRRGRPPKEEEKHPDRRLYRMSAEDKKRLDILWAEHELRQLGNAAPQQIGYRCLEVIDVPELDEEGRATGRIRRNVPCGQITYAGNHEERTRTGEVVRCPNPAHRGQLTPMEPIL